MPSTYYIEPLHHNSQCIPFPEWIQLLTLCLAPLIAHIASGTPSVSYLTHSRPRWYDNLCHYNPTSIIWRYAAIADRRIRATSWSRYDLAACNAVFWTSKGWDGGEEMVSIAAPYCSRTPGGTHVEWYSVTMLKTVITTLQGLSALYSLVGSLAGIPNTSFAEHMGVDIIFFPLAILGLLRLCAAFWLTEDFEYYSHTTQSDGPSTTTSHGYKSLSHNEPDAELTKMDTAREPYLGTVPNYNAKFKRPGGSWPSRIFRTFYLVFLAGVWVVSLLNMVPYTNSFKLGFTTTSFLVGLFYLLFLTMSIAIYAFYFIRGQTTTTLVPCIASTWYKIYSQVVLLFMFVLIIIAATETNKGPDGLYSTSPPLIRLDCAHLRSWYALLPSQDNTFRGFASNLEQVTAGLGKDHANTGKGYSGTPVAEYSTQDNVTFGDTYWLYNFTGYCVGQLE